MSKLFVMVCVLACVAPGSASAEPWKLSIDTDPTTYPLGGFSGWVMVKPGPVDHLRLGVGGFGLDFPEFLVPHLNGSGHDGDGWSLSVRAAMAFAGYEFGHREGLYIGTYVGYLESRHTLAGMAGTADRHNLTALPCVGYQWFPFGKGALAGVYVQPWLGATIWVPVGGTTTLAGRTFDDPHVIPIAAFHVGFEL